MDIRTATIDLIQINKDTFGMDKTDYMVWLGNKGVPLSILTRLEVLWDTTKKLGQTVINIGRIIIAKIVEFIEAHPHAAIGMVLGAIIGAFTGALPFIGPMLAPLSIALGSLYGYCVGARLDYSDCIQPNNEYEALILLARDFIATLVDIFSTIKEALFGDENA